MLVLMLRIGETLYIDDDTTIKITDCCNGEAELQVVSTEVLTVKRSRQISTSNTEIDHT